MKTLDAIVGIVVVAGGLHWGLIGPSEPVGPAVSGLACLGIGLLSLGYLTSRPRRLPVRVRA